MDTATFVASPTEFGRSPRPAQPGVAVVTSAMSNRFATSPDKPEGALRVSNGGTDALLAALCLAGAALARTPQHERLLVWIAGQDQALMGRGVAGFTLAELPWEAATFAADRLGGTIEV